MTVPGTSEPPASGTLSASLIPQPACPPPSDSKESTALYRFFQEDGQLLYVGITSRLRIRWMEHSRDYATTWWPKVRSNSVEWFPSRAEAERAEREAIHTEKPLFNVMHTPRNRGPRGQDSIKGSDSPSRGEALVPVIEKHFAGRPFTAADVVAVADQCPSAVEKNVRALAERGAVLVVGTRHLITKAGPRRDSVLYALPVHQWIDGKTNEPLDPSRIPEVVPQLRRKPPRATQPPKKAPAKTPLVSPSPLPALATFEEMAGLLRERGLDEHATGDTVRYRARTDEDWPIGDGKEHDYVKVANAKAMPPGPVLELYEKSPRPSGRRGPDKKPRQARGGQ